MDLKSFFNILLLGISLSTILITLVSFIIFKFRYNINSRRRKLIHNLDGAFFKRYAPHLEAENTITQLNLEHREKSKLRSPRTFFYIFIATTVVIVFLFTFESYFTYKMELTEKIDQAEKYRMLVKQGLMQKHEFNPKHTKAGMIEEFLPMALRNNFKNLKQLLRKEKIVLHSNLPSSKDPKSIHGIALKNWKEFLKRNNIPYKIASNFKFNTSDINILPQLEFLSRNEEDLINKALNHGSRILITGNLGGRDGKGRELDTNLLQKKYKMHRFENPNRDIDYPTMMSGKNMVPPGLQLPWMPLSNDVIYHAEISTTEAWASNKLSIPELSDLNLENDTAPARIVRLSNLVFWSALDPMTLTDNKQELYYADYILTSLISRIGGIPLAIVSTWGKKEIKSPFIISIDAGNQFEGIDGLDKTLSSSEINSTYFLANDIAKKNKKTITRLGRGNEYAIRRTTIQASKTESLEKEFNDIQMSRLDLEEITESKVSGIFLSYDKFESHVFEPIVQNQLMYSIGNHENQRYSPYQIANGSLTVFPKIDADANALENNMILSTPQDVEKYFIHSLEQAELLNGNFILSINPKTFAKPFYLNSLERFLNRIKERKTIQNFTFSEVAKWWGIRNKISLEIAHEENAWNISVKNYSQHEANDFDIEIEGEGVFFKCEGFVNGVLRIQKLAPDESIMISCTTK